jgi:hypothetical protein
MSRTCANEGLFVGSSFVSAVSFERKMLLRSTVLNKCGFHLSFQISSASFPTEYASDPFVYNCFLYTCSTDVSESAGP